MLHSRRAGLCESPALRAPCRVTGLTRKLLGARSRHVEATNLDSERVPNWNPNLKLKGESAPKVAETCKLLLENDLYREFE